MKTKVIIEKGETKITLTPENDFEKNVLETVFSNKNRFNIHTEVDAKYSYGYYDNHKIDIILKEIQ